MLYISQIFQCFLCIYFVHVNMGFECTANNHMQTANTKGVDHYDKQHFVRCLDIVIAII